MIIIRPWSSYSRTKYDDNDVSLFRSYIPYIHTSNTGHADCINIRLGLSIQRSLQHQYASCFCPHAYKHFNQQIKKYFFISEKMFFRSASSAILKDSFVAHICIPHNDHTKHGFQAHLVQFLIWPMRQMIHGIGQFLIKGAQR